MTSLITIILVVLQTTPLLDFIQGFENCQRANLQVSKAYITMAWHWIQAREKNP